MSMGKSVSSICLVKKNPSMVDSVGEKGLTINTMRRAYKACQIPRSDDI